MASDAFNQYITKMYSVIALNIIAWLGNLRQSNQTEMGEIQEPVLLTWFNFNPRTDK